MIDNTILHLVLVVKAKHLLEGQGEESHGTYFFKLEERFFPLCLFFSLFVFQVSFGYYTKLPPGDASPLRI
jgi:hypothetical protein